ncbi:hypothetical protein CK222_21550 [Mesorhizobium sp. WSM3866]|uniref:hypothetical protein n=1 Tax=Mesorhizobium sp. WSM3866 TaxID=422271 RepID=UPI000BAEA29D|nr:hypothetical protein [Mesorhizobium sp. WSM3866]PBB41744.1 hypothetical protein CK222_21550 [Mesorhizobium sp. WSM3866]
MSALIAFAAANPETAFQLVMLALCGVVALAMAVAGLLYLTEAERRRNRSNRRRDKRRAARMAAFRRRVRSA